MCTVLFNFVHSRWFVCYFLLDVARPFRILVAKNITDFARVKTLTVFPRFESQLSFPQIAFNLKIWEHLNFYLIYYRYYHDVFFGILKDINEKRIVYSLTF